MEAVAEGLWGLADYAEKNGEIGKAVKCLEAICQSAASFLPLVEVKTRLRVATLLLKHTHNVNQAKLHLERAHLLLNSIPSCFDLKCRTFSSLSQCYLLTAAIPPQKQILHKALHFIASVASPADGSALLWACNFSSQLANALLVEGDYCSAISALESGYASAAQLCYPELQMFFATSVLHAHLMQSLDDNLVQAALRRCDELWESLGSDRRDQCPGMLFYNELLHTFYRLRICDFKKANQHVDRLDAAMKADSQRMLETQGMDVELNALNQSLSRADLPNRDRILLSGKQAKIQEYLKNSTGLSLEPVYARRGWQDKLVLSPPPIDGEWLPKNAVYALVDLMVVIFGRPRGLFKECDKRIQSGMHTIQSELLKLGITDDTREVDLQHSAVWMAGVYLMLLMQFLENKVAIELTRSEFVEAQQALVQMKEWFIRFPTILEATECVIEMLRGQYAHSVGCYNEAVFHYIEAAKLSASRSMQAMCHVYAAVSYVCIGDVESSSQALDLIGPVYQMKDSFVGVREQASVFYAYGLLLMRQDEFEEARTRLAKGLQIAHHSMGNLQLISQYLTILGHLALALHDTVQAREILKSSLTLAKKLSDLPTQVWVLSIMTDLYQGLGEIGNEMEHKEFREKKSDELQQRLSDAHASIHHIELIDKVRVEVQQYHELGTKRAKESEFLTANLDIPESVGLSTPVSARSSRLTALDDRKRGKRRM